MENAPPPLPESPPKEPPPRLLTPQLKAALLSKVFPGLGQLYNGQKVKGSILIALVAVLVPWSLYLVFGAISQMLSSFTDLEPAPIDLSRVVEGLALMAFTIGVWIYSVWDAWSVCKKKANLAAPPECSEPPRG
ncbi:MAG: hypothetical protein AB1758_15865 [Candidatus Eremiobacterota bacterium]